MLRTGSIALPTTPDLGYNAFNAHARPRRTRTVLTWAAVFLITFAAGYLSHTVPKPSSLLPAVSSFTDSTAALLPSPFRSRLSSSSSRHRAGLRPSSRGPPPSCRLCDATPDDPLCAYGDSAVRLSRAYEGSGIRVRRFLEKALRGEEVTVGVVGASVSVGHGLGGAQTWADRWFEGFQEQFPKSKLINGAVPAMDSKFFSYCYHTMIPEPADLYIVELDINEDWSGNTFDAQDALLRALLDQPHQPAVMKVSVFALSFSELLRGTAVSLITSQFFDVPIISVRNVLQPITIARPDIAPQVFAEIAPGSGWPDYRHMNVVGHNTLADMITLYMHEQTCLAEQERRRPRLQPKETPIFPPNTEEIYEAIPRLHLWEQWDEKKQAKKVTPICDFAGSPTSPLVPLPPRAGDGEAWQKLEWNDKTAIASSDVGSIVRFQVEGSSVGLFIWTWSGNKHTRPEKMPGQMRCWIDEQTTTAMTLDAYTTAEAAAPAWIMLDDGLDEGKHVLSCEIINSSSTTGHEVRIMGVVSH
ncbi:hypothetical protein JCM10207_005637 [Rhodosporidiobolus poonsookiae]